jgi:hypothetical protein
VLEETVQESNLPTQQSEVEDEKFFEFEPEDTLDTKADLEAALEELLSGQEIQEDRPRQKSFFPTSVPGEFNQSLMAQVLDNKSAEDRAKILQIAYQSGVEKDDPLFAVMLALGDLEQLIDAKPSEIDQLFDDWKQRWQKELTAAEAAFEAETNRIRTLIRTTEEMYKAQSQAALDVQSQSISNTVESLVRKAALDKVSWDMYALIRAGFILLGTLGAGVVLGLGIPLFAKPPELDPTGSRQLTLEQAEAMNWGLSEAGRFARSHPELIQWARSHEGKYARQFMQWNQTLLSGGRKRVCEKDVERLGVTLTLEGRVAKSGFCTLWTRSPESREFVK